MASLRKTGIGVLSAVFMLGLVSCNDEQRFCGPAPLVVEPDPASVGSVVTLSAPAAQCDLGQVGAYSIRLVSPEGAEFALGEVEPASSGQFSVDLQLPPGAGPGSFALAVDGSVLDDASATEGPGYAESQASYEVQLEIIT